MPTRFFKNILENLIKNSFSRNALIYTSIFAICSFLIYLKEAPSKEETPQGAQASFPFYNKCKNPKPVTLSFNSRLLVHESFADALHLKSKPLPGIKSQLKYMAGYFHFREESPTVKIGKPYDIKINKIAQENYPISLKLNYDQWHNYEDLPKGFQAPQSLANKDLAISIAYQAKADAIICDDSNENALSFTLPIDPYLAYWSSSFKSLPSPGGGNALVPDCASERMASDNNPAHLWYFWKPHACASQGEDGSGAHLTVKADLSLGSPQDKKELRFNLLKSNPRPRIALIFGYIGYGNEDKIKEGINKVLNSKNGIKVLTDKKIAEKLFTEHEVDPSLRALSVLIQKFQDYGKIQSIGHKDNTHYDSFKLALDLGPKQLAVEIYLGPTDYKRGFAKHYPFLEKALKSKNAIYYIAHSGHGENLNLENMRKNLGYSKSDFSKLLNQQEYLLFANVSCFSTYFHGDSFLEQRSQKGRMTDLILMGSEGYGFQAPLALIALLKGEQGKKALSASYLRDFYSLERKVN